MHYHRLASLIDQALRLEALPRWDPLDSYDAQRVQTALLEYEILWTPTP